MKTRDLTGLVAVVGIMIVVPIAFGLLFATSKLGAASIPIWAIVGGASWLILKGPIGEALAKKLRGESGDLELQGELLQEVDELRTRVAELEERQDFSERLLARKDEPQRLEAPK
ncbi:MAG: hypothetical protein ABJB33_06835 [Gemmatimonadota bacterium]